MTSSDPYGHPTTKIGAPAGADFRWRRVLAFAALMYVLGALVGIASAFVSISYWEAHGFSEEAAALDLRMYRRIVAFVVITLVYWRMAAPVQHRIRHVAALFVVYQLLDAALGYFVFAQSTQQLLSWEMLGRNLLAAAIGLVLASLGARSKQRSSRPAGNGGTP